MFMKHSFRYILIAFVVALAAQSAWAEDADVLQMDVDQNIAVPAVPAKAKTYVKTAMDQLRRHLAKNGIKASAIRGGEVLQVVVPCDSLFRPCSDELKPTAGKFLRNLGVVVREPGRYKVIVAVHADDTGDDDYADTLTIDRANSIDEYLWELSGQKDTNVIPYGLGKDEFLEPLNNTRRARAANRRVEFFIVPDKVLLQMAGVKIK